MTRSVRFQIAERDRSHFDNFVLRGCRPKRFLTKYIRVSGFSTLSVMRGLTRRRATHHYTLDRAAVFFALAVVGDHLANRLRSVLHDIAFVAGHETLCCTPAMALGVTDHVWTIAEFLQAALKPSDVPPLPRPVQPTTLQPVMPISDSA